MYSLGLFKVGLCWEDVHGPAAGSEFAVGTWVAASLESPTEEGLALGLSPCHRGGRA